MLFFFFLGGKKSSFLIYQNSFFFFFLSTLNISLITHFKKLFDNFCIFYKKISKIKDQHVIIFRVPVCLRQAPIMEDIEREKEKES